MVIELKLNERDIMAAAIVGVVAFYLTFHFAGWQWTLVAWFVLGAIGTILWLVHFFHYKNETNRTDWLEIVLWGLECWGICLIAVTLGYVIFFGFFGWWEFNTLQERRNRKLRGEK